jgi:hypothetical protein
LTLDFLAAPDFLLTRIFCSVFRDQKLRSRRVASWGQLLGRPGLALSPRSTRRRVFSHGVMKNYFGSRVFDHSVQKLNSRHGHEKAQKTQADSWPPFLLALCIRPFLCSVSSRSLSLLAND